MGIIDNPLKDTDLKTKSKLSLKVLNMKDSQNESSQNRLTSSVMDNTVVDFDEGTQQTKMTKKDDFDEIPMTFQDLQKKRMTEKTTETVNKKCQISFKCKNKAEVQCEFGGHFCFKKGGCGKYICEKHQVDLE